MGLKRPRGPGGGAKTFLACYRWKKWVWRIRKRAPLELVSVFLFDASEGIWNGFTEGNLMAIKRVNPSDVLGVATALPANLGTWGKRYPNLVERVVVSTYEDGTRRTPSRPTLEYKQGVWVATITEPDVALMIQAELEQPDDWVMALEGLLALPSPPWQHCPWLTPKPARKGKK
jgi:hypothetical protein